MKPLQNHNDTFELVMIPAFIMGVATNAYIATILYLVDLKEVLLSPLIGTAIFLLSWYLMSQKKISALTGFIIASLVVLVEVTIHTHFLGLDCGFTYFLFLLPLVFLLQSDWTPTNLIVFNSVVLLSFIGIWYQYGGVTPGHFMPEGIVEIIRIGNVTGTGIVIVVIMIYFSRALHKKDILLTSANRVLAHQNEEITEQHQQLQVLIKEIHHRVKNNLQIISSLMSLQTRTVSDEEVLEVLNEGRRRVDAIAMIHQKLYQDEHANKVDFESYLNELIDMQKVLSPNVSCSAKSDHIVLDLDRAVPLGLIISELLTNSMKHAFNGIDSPEFHIEFSKEKEHYILDVQDNGVGLPEGFNLEKTKGLGGDIILALTEQINAKLFFENKKGAHFQITF